MRQVRWKKTPDDKKHERTPTQYLTEAAVFNNSQYFSLLDLHQVSGESSTNFKHVFVHPVIILLISGVGSEIHFGQACLQVSICLNMFCTMSSVLDSILRAHTLENIYFKFIYYPIVLIISMLRIMYFNLSKIFFDNVMLSFLTTLPLKHEDGCV